MPSRERISGDSLLVTAMRICAAFWQERLWKLLRAMCLKDESRAGSRAEYTGEIVSSLFPMFMKLEGRRCLVVGAGKVGEPKIASLIDTGALIKVVAADALEATQEWAKAGKITL